MYKILIFFIIISLVSYNIEIFLGSQKKEIFILMIY